MICLRNFFNFFSKKLKPIEVKMNYIQFSEDINKEIHRTKDFYDAYLNYYSKIFSKISKNKMTKLIKAPNGKIKIILSTKKSNLVLFMDQNKIYNDNNIHLFDIVKSKDAYFEIINDLKLILPNFFSYVGFYKFDKIKEKLIREKIDGDLIHKSISKENEIDIFIQILNIMNLLKYKKYNVNIDIDTVRILNTCDDNYIPIYSCTNQGIFNSVYLKTKNLVKIYTFKKEEPNFTIFKNIDSSHYTSSNFEKSIKYFLKENENLFEKYIPNNIFTSVESFKSFSKLDKRILPEIMPKVIIRNDKNVKHLNYIINISKKSEKLNTKLLISNLINFDIVEDIKLAYSTSEITEEDLISFMNKYLDNILLFDDLIDSLIHIDKILFNDIYIPKENHKSKIIYSLNETCIDNLIDIYNQIISYYEELNSDFNNLNDLSLLISNENRIMEWYDNYFIIAALDNDLEPNFFEKNDFLNTMSKLKHNFETKSEELNEIMEKIATYS